MKSAAIAQPTTVLADDATSPPIWSAPHHSENTFVLKPPRRASVAAFRTTDFHATSLRQFSTEFRRLVPTEVCYLDAPDTDQPVGFNPLANAPSHRRAFAPSAGRHYQQLTTSVCQPKGTNVIVFRARAPRLRNPDQLRRGKNYHPGTRNKGVNIGRRFGVKFGMRTWDNTRY